MPSIRFSHPSVLLVAGCMSGLLLGNFITQTALSKEGDFLLPSTTLPDFSEQVEVVVNGKTILLKEAIEHAWSKKELHEYRKLRAEHGTSISGQYELAKWCRTHGLKEEEMLHWRVLLSHQPDHAEAIRQLGLKKYQGRLLPAKEMDRIKEEDKKQKRATKLWVPRLRKIRQAIKRGNPAEREQAIQALVAIDDPLAIPAVLDVFADSEPEVFIHAVDMLSGISDLAAIEVLVQQAVESDSSDIRKAASYHLKQEDYLNYVPKLISGLAAPIEISSSISRRRGKAVYESNRAYVPTGRVRPWLYNKVRLSGNYSANDVAAWSSEVKQVWNSAITGFRPDRYRLRYRLTRESPDPDSPFELDGAIEGSSEAFAASASEFQERIEAINKQTAQQNRLIHEALTIATGVKIAQGEEIDPRVWWQWWRKQLQVNNYFAQGMEVWTQMGLTSIEDIMIGDRVLSRDLESHKLGFQLVVGLDIQPQDKMQMLEVQGRSVVATPDQIFYLTGLERRKAKDLQKGIKLVGLQGTESISDNGPGAAVATFSLMIENSSNFFVDRLGIMVADATPLQTLNKE